MCDGCAKGVCDGLGMARPSVHNRLLLCDEGIGLVCEHLPTCVVCANGWFSLSAGLGMRQVCMQQRSGWRGLSLLVLAGNPPQLL